MAIWYPTNGRPHLSIYKKCTMGRLYDWILCDLIGDYKPFQKEQGSFRVGQSWTDNIFCLKHIIEKKVATNRELNITFIDLQKAYNVPLFPLNKMWEVLEASHINHTLVKALQKVKLPNQNQFSVTKGLKQCCCVFPTFFKIYIAARL